MDNKTRDRWEQFLLHDEVLQTSLPAQGGVHPFALLAPGVGAVVAAVLTTNQPAIQVVLMIVAFTLIGGALTTARYRVIGITDKSVLLCTARALRPAKPVKLMERLSHGDNFTPNGAFWGQVQVGPEKLWVHKRFFDRLQGADLDAAPLNTHYRDNRAKKKVKHARRRR